MLIFLATLVMLKSFRLPPFPAPPGCSSSSTRVQSSTGHNLPQRRASVPLSSSSTSEVFEGPLTPDDPRIVPIDLNEEMKTSFMSYAMSTILSRALPDARDGLKPVHRRVLYAMQCLNLTPDSSYRKCARVVGEVLGKFHPHGDQSVYDALVRMVQDFVMLHPLVAGHGNFGSVDNDPPAAMRYTEAKLSGIAYDTLLQDIKEDTVDFVANFDGNEMEPLVLPARVPMLLLNGASGIAVGMATNIPPHNLGELCDGVVALVDNPAMTDKELIKIIPAPDFPTGGLIMGHAGSESMYKTGNGRIIMRAKCHTEVITTAGKTGSRTKTAIVITELPYMTNKAMLLEKIADLVNDKKLEGIADLRDESDRDGVRVVVELKRDAIPALVQNNLLKKTALQASFSGNMVVLVDKGKQPQRVTLREALDIFIGYRFLTLRRRATFQLSKVRSRLHIVEGLVIALQRIDDIIALLKSSKDQAAARLSMTSDAYGLSAEQAEAILGLRLGRLTALEEQKLAEERTELTRDIAQLETFMRDDRAVYEQLKKETMELKAQYATPRKTQIMTDDSALSVEDLVANDRSVVMITSAGYIKRLPIEEFEAQSRGGKGKAGARLSAEDESVAHFFSCNDHDSILFATDRGIAYSVKAYQVPLGSRIARGVPLPQVLPIASEDQVTSVIPVDDFQSADEHLVLMTSKGFVKKTPLKAFESISARGLIIISLGENDKLRWARRCKPEEDVLVATRDGFAARFSTTDLPSTSRNSRGVRALKLREGDEMADIDIVKGDPESRAAAGDDASETADEGADGDETEDVNDADELEEAEGGAATVAEGKGSSSTAEGSSDRPFVLMVTEKGYGKRVELNEFRMQKKGGKGITAIRFKKKAGGGGQLARSTGTERSQADAVSCMRVCRAGDEVVISTRKGTVIRQSVDDLSVQSRTATGVRIQKLRDDDKIITVDIVPSLPVMAGTSVLA